MPQLVSLFMQLFRVSSDSSGLSADYGKPVVKLSLERALLCLDCESVFEAEGPQKCPSCGSSVAWTIGRALNRQSVTVDGGAHD